MNKFLLIAFIYYIEYVERLHLKFLNPTLFLIFAVTFI